MSEAAELTHLRVAGDERTLCGLPLAEAGKETHDPRAPIDCPSCAIAMCAMRDRIIFREPPEPHL